MTPQEKKARELVEKFSELGVWTDYARYEAAAKECAFVACNELEREETAIPKKIFWQEVKQAINKL